MDNDVPTVDYFAPLLTVPPAEATPNQLRVYRVLRRYVELVRKADSPGYSKSRLKKAIFHVHSSWNSPLGLQVRALVEQFYNERPHVLDESSPEILTHGKSPTGGGIRVIKSPRYN
jgi:hypothetical protein